MPCLLCGNLEAPNLFSPAHSCAASQETLCPHCMEMRQLEAQIYETQQTLEKMLEQHRELRTLMNHSHDPIVLRVPPEVAGSIFQFCMPVDDAIVVYNRGHKSELRAPLTLGAVCRGWRQIAWSIPQLWNTFSIRLKESGLVTRCEIGQQWLARSGKLPLSLHVEASSSADIHLAQKFQPLIAAINQQCSRWKHLDLKGSTAFISLFSDDLQGTSILQRLQLWSPRTICEFRLKNVNHRPTHVTIGSSFQSNAIDIQWNDITRLTLGSLDVMECAKILQDAPKLLYFKFTSLTPSTSATTQTSVTHEQLQSLDISCTSAIGDLLFDKLTFPSLRKLILSFTTKNAPTDSFISFLERSCFSLTTLTIKGTEIDSEDTMLRILRATPLLSDLLVVHMKAQPYEALARLLTNTPDISSCSIKDNNFFPALKLIYVTLTEFPSWTALLDMFGSPANISSPLRHSLRTLKVTVVIRNQKFQYIEPENITRFLDLRRLGIMLEVWLTNTTGTVYQDFLQQSIDFHHEEGNKECPTANV